jgi:predicted transposase YdaD
MARLCLFLAQDIDHNSIHFAEVPFQKDPWFDARSFAESFA